MGNITMKFGGTSVGSIEAIDSTANIVLRSLAEGHQVAVIVSAMSGVTDMLLKSVRSALADVPVNRRATQSSRRSRGDWKSVCGFRR